MAAKQQQQRIGFIFWLGLGFAFIKLVKKSLAGTWNQWKSMEQQKQQKIESQSTRSGNTSFIYLLTLWVYIFKNFPLKQQQKKMN